MSPIILALLGSVPVVVLAILVIIILVKKYANRQSQLYTNEGKCDKPTVPLTSVYNNDQDISEDIRETYTQRENPDVLNGTGMFNFIKLCKFKLCLHFYFS